MLEIPDNINNLITDMSSEIEAIKHTFVSTTEKQKDSFKPFAVFFSDPDTKSFVITSRPIHDANDYYTAISEMLFAYSSNESEAVLFAVDSNKVIDDHSHDLLEVYMACDDYCTLFTFPYTLDDNGKFHWNENLFNTHTMETLEKAYDTSGQFHASLEIFEALYLHTHMRIQHFDIVKLKSFYDANNFNYAHLKEQSLEVNSLSL
jgi:hypothetical protein